jgi:hypothetical protein
MSSLDDWIVYCADPLGSRKALPRRPLSPDQVDRLIDQAEAHGVLGGLLKNQMPLRADPAFEAGRNAARDRHLANTAFSMLLAREADALMADVRDLPAAVVKGPAFARALYPMFSLRCFTDIDILVAPEGLVRLAEVLSDHGYRCVQRSPHEHKWLHGDNENLMIEVQTDLVHADSLNGVMSLPYEVIATAPEGIASLLLVALVHGGGHQYERLQHVVDICQAARALTGSAEQRLFRSMVNAANARFIAVAGLMLAYRIFDEPRCREIADALGPVRYRSIAGLFMDQTVVMSSMDSRRAWYRWRRHAFRWLIKRSGSRQPETSVRHPMSD